MKKYIKDFYFVYPCDIFIPMYVPPGGHLPKTQTVFQEEPKAEREGKGAT